MKQTPVSTVESASPAGTTARSGLVPFGFTFRQCLWLCLPALILGAWVRIAFLVALPHGFYGSDSNSYFHTATRLWTEGKLAISEKRRWIYPILLAPTPALPVSPARSIPVFQHLLGLLTVVGIGWIVGNLTRFRMLWVPVVTTLAAVWPRMVWFEHEVVVESPFLAAFVFTAALAMPPEAIRDRRRLFWFIIGVAAIGALRPHGRGIWLGCMVAAVLLAGNPLHWGRKCWIAAGVGVVLLLTAGSSRVGNWLLLNSALPLVNLEGAKYQEYRDELKPVVLEARKNIDEWPWLQEDFKKRLSATDPAAVSPKWGKLASHDAEFSKVASTLAKEAVFTHPIQFAQLTLTKIGIALAKSDDIKRFDPAKFWAGQLEKNEGRWDARPAEMRLFYRMNRPDYDRLVEVQSVRENRAEPILDRVADSFAWLEESDQGEKHSLHVAWLGALAVFGFLTCLTPRRFVATAVVWLPGAIYLVTVFAIADRLPRYVHPIEWIGLVLAALGIDFVLFALYSFISTRVKRAESTVTQTV